MKKHIRVITIPAFVLFFLYHSSVSGQKTDLEKMNIKGRVNSIRELHYRIDGDSLNYAIIGADVSYSYFFNPEGNKKEDLIYHIDGSLNRKFKFQYDESGHKSSQTQYTANDSLIRTIKYSYDKDGMLNEEIYYNGAGNKEKKIAYHYDKKGNVTEEKHTTGGGKLLYRFSYTYDDEGKLTDNQRFDRNGKLEKRVKSFNDSAGNVTREEIYNDGDQRTHTGTFQYKSDLKGNWIKKLEFSDNNISYLVEREIKYY